MHIRTNVKLGNEIFLLSSEVDGIEEAAIEFDAGIEAVTCVEAGVSSAGVSKADEGDTKLSFFFRNSSSRLAFLLIVEGLGFFLLGAVCPRPAHCHLSQRRKKSPKPK